jgi:hypothetical protein
MANITIEGAEQEVRCDCCNRRLKVGIRTSALGTIGADCLRAAMVSDRKRFSQGKPDASFLRELAVMRETKTAEYISIRRGIPASMFSFELAVAA